MTAPHERTQGFARNEDQELLLRRLNGALNAAEEALELPEEPDRPLLLIVGAPRSGTTLLLQWLAASGHFGYPSNLIARFYGAPAIGAHIQQLLFDPALDYRGELSLSADTSPWSSNYGKTRGALQPHEFFYYWRRFFPVEHGSKLTDEQLSHSDPAGFAAGWAHLEAILGKPLAFKALLLQYDIELLAEWLPTAIFVHLHRDEMQNAESLLGARRAVHGNDTRWFSVRPPGYEALLTLGPMDQVLGQVRLTNAAITRSLAALPPERSLTVSYASFCDDPTKVWQRLQNTLSAAGERLPPYDGPPAFPR